MYVKVGSYLGDWIESPDHLHAVSIVIYETQKPDESKLYSKEDMAGNRGSVILNGQMDVLDVEYDLAQHQYRYTLYENQEESNYDGSWCPWHFQDNQYCLNHNACAQYDEEFVDRIVEDLLSAYF